MIVIELRICQWVLWVFSLLNIVLYVNVTVTLVMMSVGMVTPARFKNPYMVMDIVFEIVVIMPLCDSCREKSR